MSFLRVSGTKIVDGEGKEIVLRGAGLGGWMCMENFISGYPGREFQIREALAQVIGPEKSEFFFDKFLEHFFAEPDAAFFASLGLNCIRIAISYRHFEDDMNPRVLKPSGFKHLDRAIRVCAQHGIYTVIDMHTAPGGQNGGWHSDNGAHVPLFWRHGDFQDRLVWLWGEIARRYRDEVWVAGYNVMNEPSDPKGTGLIALYDKLNTAIRAVDPNHILFLDGNTYSVDFSAFPSSTTDDPSPWPNCAYAIHDYSVYGFPTAPEPYDGAPAQKERMWKSYTKKRQWMDDRGLCVWNGEWGPVYARKEYEGEETESINERRYHVLKDQLELYRKDNLSWSIWLYKDIGFQGMVHVSRSTPYMTRLSAFLAKKHRLAADHWGSDPTPVAHVFDPITQIINDNLANEEHKKLYPPLWTVEGRVSRLVRTTLVADYLVMEWAEHFRGMDEKELEEMARSFSFENCVLRERLNAFLREDVKLASQARP